MIEIKRSSDTITIVVLNYATSEVIIHENVDNELIDEKYEGDVESYLVEEFDYKSSQIYYMCGDNIEVKYENGK